MALKDTWVDKVDGEDINSAEDINSVAQAVIDLEKEKIGAPDFSANEGEDGFIKNRTHYVDRSGNVKKLDNKFINAEWMSTTKTVGSDSTIFAEASIPFTNETKMVSGITLIEGQRCIVYWNDTPYECYVKTYAAELYIGNPALAYSALDPDVVPESYPFCISYFGSSASLIFKDTSTSEDVKLKIEGFATVVYNKLPKEFLPDDIGGKPDLAENDPNAAGYVKNRTHYSELVDAVLFPEQTITIANNQCMKPGLMGLVAGDTYTVVWNGTTYTCVAEEWNIYGNSSVAIGNPAFTGGENNNMPFGAADVIAQGAFGFMAMVDGDYTVSITGKKEIVHQLPAKYSNEFRVLLTRVDSYNYFVMTTVEEIVSAIESGKQVYVIVEANFTSGSNYSVHTRKWLRFNMTYADYTYLDGQIYPDLGCTFLFEGTMFAFDEEAGTNGLNALQRATIILVRPDHLSEFKGILFTQKFVNGTID